MTFLLDAKNSIKRWDLVELDDGVMVGPGLFETVREQFDGRRTLAVPYQKASCRGAESADHPKNIFHALPLFLCLDSSVAGTTVHIAGWMREGCDVLLVCEWRFRGCGGNGYTLGMDSVRFGRVLGIGARLAAKTMVSAVDAATAPNPSAAKAKDGADAASVSTAASASAAASGKGGVPGVRLAQQAARTTAQVRQTGRGLKEGGKRFGEAVWGPFVKLSGALWLELTGVFFGIFAVFAASNAWKMRWALRETAGNHDAHARLLFAAGMAIVFGYFCVTSFVKANRRVKRS